MFHKRGQEFFVLVDDLSGQFDLIDDLLNIPRSEIRHFDIFDLVPARLDHIQFRRVGWQAFKLKPIRVVAFVFCLESFVALQVVPDDDDFATEMFVQFVKDIRHFGTFRTAGKCRREKLHPTTNWRDGNNADGRKASPFFRFEQDVRAADRRPALQEKWYERKTALVQENYVPTVVRGFFLMTGHWHFRQRRTASAEYFADRLTGFLGEYPRARRMRHVWALEYETWNFSRIN
jgi:hypothetical protein